MDKGKKKGFFFKKKEKKPVFVQTEQEVGQELTEPSVEEIPKEVAEAKPAQKFQRKRRMVEKEEEASVEEVKAAVSKSIFKKDISDKKERDLLGKKKNTSGSMFSTGSSEEVDDTVMGLSQEIADAFGIKTDTNGESIYDFEENQQEERKDTTFAMFAPLDNKEEKEESEEQTEQENEDFPFPVNLEKESEPKTDVLKRLKEVTLQYQEREDFCESGFCEFETKENSLDIIKTDNGFLFANRNIFVNGVRQFWDRTFEVRIPKGAVVEVGTGVSMKVPQGVRTEIQGVPDLEAKHSLRFTGSSVRGEVTAFFQAGEAAYLSKIGRVIQCQFVGG